MREASMRIIPDSEILFVTLLFLSPSMIWMTAACVKDWLNEHHNNRKDIGSPPLAPK
jgi:hypothetical protein